MENKIEFKGHFCETHPKEIIMFTPKDRVAVDQLYCFKCISEKNLNSIETINQFFQDAEEAYSKIKGSLKIDEKLSEECSSIFDQKEAAIANLKKKIIAEKVRVDEFYDHFIAQTTELLNKARDRSKKQLDDQVRILSERFETFYQKHQRYSLKHLERDTIPTFQSLVSRANNLSSLEDYKRLVKDVKADIAEYENLGKTQNLKDTIENIVRDSIKELKEQIERDPVVPLGNTESLLKKFDDMIKSECVEQQKIQISPRKTPKPEINIESKIASDFSFIQKNLAFKNLSLLYRATDQGFTAMAFHKHCDNKGPTLVLIKSDNGSLFGGYSEQPWDSTGTYKSSSKSFLFSLNHEQIFKIREPTYSILCQNYGPTFGGGNSSSDIYLGLTFSQKICATNLGNTYESKGFANTYLTNGAPKFSCAEVEVFQVISQIQQNALS